MKSVFLLGIAESIWISKAELLKLIVMDIALKHQTFSRCCNTKSVNFANHFAITSAETIQSVFFEKHVGGAFDCDG